MVLKENGNIIDDPNDVATTFNHHFTRGQVESSNSDDRPARYQNDVFQKLGKFVASKKTSEMNFSIPLMDVDFVCKQLSELQSNKAKGVDNISPYFFKVAAPIIAPSLCHIFNISIIANVFPDLWKVAKVTPLHKKV